MGITVGAYINEGGHVGGHMRDVELHPLIERVLVTGSAQAREIAAGMDRAEFIADWDTLLAAADVPLIIMLTNNREATRLTLEAVQAGRRVYGEKPGARTAEEMGAIVEACTRTGAHFTPCYARRTFPDTLEVRRLIDAGAVGELWSFQANWLTSSAALRGPEHWLFDRELAGGGILHWLGCHFIDLLRFVTGQRIVAVSAMTASVQPDISVEDVACLSARLEGGAIGTIRCGYVNNVGQGGYQDYQLMTAYEGSAGLIAHFPHGTVTVRSHSRPTGVPSGPELRELRIEAPRVGGYAYALLDDVVRATMDDRPPLVTAEDALYVLRVIDAVGRSARTGQEVEVE